MNLEQYLSKTPDFPKPGILFYDLSPILLDPKAWAYTVAKLKDLALALQPELIAGIEARGFLLSASVSLAANLGSLLVRKKGKLPGKAVISHTYDLEYGTDTLELNKALVKKGQKVLVVDDVLATGGTALATIELLKKAECIPVGFLCILELSKLNGREQIPLPVHSLITI